MIFCAALLVIAGSIYFIGYLLGLAAGIQRGKMLWKARNGKLD